MNFVKTSPVRLNRTKIDLYQFRGPAGLFGDARFATFIDGILEKWILKLWKMG